MSGIVLSASVRQNLLSLQSTADLLATTQNRLATGKKVNTALDNPTNFFTAQSLDARAGDINNLLDGIGNGVQVLQAANTGITSLQKLVDTAKSLANQALQSAVGYSTKSNVSATITGATATDLRGTTSYTSATAASNVLFSGAAGGTTAATSTLTLGGIAGTLTGVATNTNDTTAPPVISAATLLNDAPTGTSAGLSANTVADGDSFTVNGHTITFKAGAAPLAGAAPSGYGIDAGAASVATDGNGNSIIYIGASSTTSTATVGDVLRAIDLASGVRSAVISNGAATVSTNAGQTASTVNGTGQVLLQTSTGGDLEVSGKADFLKAFGLTTALGSGITTVGATRSTSAATLGNLIQDGSTLNVNGKTITFKNAPTPGAGAVAAGSGVSGNVVNDGSGNSTVFLQAATMADVLSAIDLATGVRTATNASGAATVATASGQTNSSINSSGSLQISTGTTADLNIIGTGNTLSALGLNGNTGTATSFTAGRTAAPGSLSGKTLTFTSFNGGTPVNVTFGDGSNGTVKTLDQLNACAAGQQPECNDRLGRQADDLHHQRLCFVDARLAVVGWCDRRYADHRDHLHDRDGPGRRCVGADGSQQPGEPVQRHPVADHDHRAGRVVQRHQPAGRRSAQADVQRNRQVDAEHHRRQLQCGRSRSGEPRQRHRLHRQLRDQQGYRQPGCASTLLRTQASALGSNLSIVQIRQDFSKNLINVLQTGSSNLTLADTNEEAANSQALSTRQSIAVSALALANQSQQSVLQLLR